jgi:hypothetical protein
MPILGGWIWKMENVARVESEEEENLIAMETGKINRFAMKNT